MNRQHPAAALPPLVLKRAWDREVIIAVGVLGVVVGSMLIIGVAVTL